MLEKDILIEDLVREYPKAVGFLMKRGIVCIQCGEPVWGTLEETARKKGVDDIGGLVKDLDEFLDSE